MTNPDYRAMCAELLEAFDSLPCETNYKGQSRPIVYIDEEPFTRARALLAEAEPQPPVVIDSMETLSLRMLDAFWSFANNLMPIGSPDRMREVLRLLANEIETWAPSYTESKICHLAVTEVAQRLRAEADQ